MKKVINDTLYVRNRVTCLYSNGNSNSPSNKIFTQGDIFYSIDENKNMYKVAYLPPLNSQLVNISFENTDSTTAILSLFRKGWVKKSDVQRRYISHLTNTQERREIYIFKHPKLRSIYKSDIRSGKIRIGMSKETVEASWGKPKDINRSVYSFGVHEQWIYGKIGSQKYLYFEDGVLKSWQE